MSNSKAFLTPLRGLLAGRSLDEVECFTVAEMKKYRSLRDEASFLDLRLANPHDCLERVQVEREYVVAMIAMHAQQAVVSTMLEILGYIPDFARSDHHCH